MSAVQLNIKVRLSKDEIIEFEGLCLARVVAMNHDDSVRRQFCVYSCTAGYVAERIDSPDTIDVRFWGALCKSSSEIYEFFGNEPLANYLYGAMRLSVPGMRFIESHG